MRYSTPYNDKITLPHIKKINTIGINTDNLYYDSRELSGTVIIDGEYLTDEDEIMSFTHDLPVSILIDDEEVEPEIHISNFKYELIPGIGLEIMFELDMILVDTKEEEKEQEEVINKRIEEIDQQLAESKENLESLSNSSADEAIKHEDEIDPDVIEFKNQIDQNLSKIIGDRKVEQVTEEVKDEEITDSEEDTESKKEEASQEEITPVLEEKIRDEEEPVTLVTEPQNNPIEELSDVNEILEEVLEEAEEIEVLDEQVEVKAEVVTEKLNTKLQSTSASFDIGFIGAQKDRYTTYKILLLEENENVEEVLDRKNLSRALVCDDFESDTSKVILKIENDND